MRIHSLTDYYILSIKPNAEKFLNGLTTNITTAKQNACIDRFGRIVAAFWQKRINEDEILIILDKRASGPLLEHLKKHLALTKTKIERKKELFVYYDLDKKEILLSTEKLQSVSEEEFTIFRLQNNIPLQYADFTNEMILNVSYDFVSFTKGCYLGQEVVARVHHLGRAPKKLIPDFEAKKFVFVEN